MDKIILDGFSMNWQQVRTCLYALPKISLSEEAKERLHRSRKIVEDSLAHSESSLYAINTGFGKLATVQIPSERIEQVQENLVHSHAVGVGDPLPENISRLTVLLRANVLAQGYSGVRPELVSFLCDLINKGVTPVIPSQGSVGASGDLAPLAHVAKVLLGLGDVWFQGERKSTASVFKKLGLQSISLKAKEGLSLINGTQFSLAIACHVLLQAEKLLKLADITAAISVEGDLASHKPFDEKLIRLRPHAGALKTAANLRKLLAESEIEKGHEKCQRVQDPYSLRCVPQVHGAVKEAYHFAKHLLETELNATTDNPLIFADTKEVISGGNFHGEPIALAMDTLSIALTDLGSISERRVALLIDPPQKEIPTQFLIPEPGLHSGFMIPQYVMSALVSENKTLAHPAMVDSIPTSAGQEDHVSMSAWAARKANQIVANVEKILGIELLAGCQAIDFSSQGKRAGKGVQAIHHYIRERLPMLKEDKPLGNQLLLAQKLVAEGIPITVVEEAVGNLEL